MFVYKRVPLDNMTENRRWLTYGAALAPFQLVLVGIHDGQLGRGLEAPAVFTVLLGTAPHGWPCYAVAFSSMETPHPSGWC